MIKKIAFVAQPTTDLQGSLEFYGELLGLERTAYHEMGDQAWVEFDTPDGKSIALDMFSACRTTASPTAPRCARWRSCSTPTATR